MGITNDMFLTSYSRTIKLMLFAGFGECSRIQDGQPTNTGVHGVCAGVSAGGPIRDIMQPRRCVLPIFKYDTENLPNLPYVSKRFHSNG